MKGQDKFDITIIGGGPAGTATAIALLNHQPNLRILIVEKTSYGNFRVGETLSPAIRDLMEQLGIWEAFQAETHLEAYGTASVWGSNKLLENEFVYHKGGNGWHLDRSRFDLFLAKKAEDNGANIILNTRLINSVKRVDNQYNLTLKTKQKDIQTIQTSFIVDASGRNGLFAKSQGAQKIFFDKLTSAFWVFEQNPNDFIENTYTLVEAVQEGWWYSARIPNNRIVFSFMSDVQFIKQLNIKRQKTWKKLVNQTTYTKARINPLDQPIKQFVQPAFSHRLDKVTGKAWIAVGDAASTFDPLSAQGIYKSIKSGIFAAYAILDYFKGIPTGLKKYDQYIAEEYESYWQTKLTYYRKEKRWANRPFWEKRHAYITLQPHKALTFQPSNFTKVTKSNSNLYFSSKALASFPIICQQVRSAAEIVQEFKSINPQNLSDSDIILGIQHLCEKGILKEVLD